VLKKRRLVVLTVAALVTTMLTPTGPANAVATRFEAESATISQGVVESNHLGFSGTGFVNYNNLVGSYVQFTVTAPAAGTATVAFRFANGTTTNRPMDVTLDGTLIADELSFAGTGSWDTWQTKSVATPVNAGPIVIRATATTANGGPNLDFIDVDFASQQGTDYQAENATVSQGVVASNHLGYTGTGFVDYTNVIGSYVQFSVNAQSAGAMTFEIRYANGTTASRPMDITVNGVLVADELSFGPTGNWDTWASKTFSANVNAGANAIRATATSSSGGPNVDKLRASAQGGPPPPWHPGYLAIGTVYTPGSTVDSFFSQMASHGPVPTYGYKYLLGNEFSSWSTVAGTQVSRARQLGMLPVLVEYGMNGNVDGVDVHWTNMQNASWVAQFFTALKAGAQAAAANAGATPVGWIIEPDMLGYIQQQHGGAFGNDATRMPAATSAAYSSGVLGAGDPAYPNTLAGLVQAINHTIKKYNPSAFLGWQVNTWGVRNALKDTDTMGISAGRASIVNVANQVSGFLRTANVAAEAELISFDQWGQDFGVFRDPNPAGNVRYLNATHWNNYLLYVKTIRQALNLPAVLWQIACGHLNSTQTASPTYWNADGRFPDLDDTSPNRYQDSASSYFFGDRFSASGNYLAFFGSNADADPKVSVSGATVTWGSHLPEAAAAGVVAIMFGAGTGTGTHGVPQMTGQYQSTPSDFYYWVTRTQTYLAAPLQLTGA
jgi:Carbohydrate binding module (family 6)